MKVGVIGAGGIGGYYGGLLSRGGHDVRVLARGANLDAIRRNGLRVKTPEDSWVAKVAASDDAAELANGFGEGDFAMIATKSYSLKEVAPAAKIFAEKGATIVPFNNGVEAAEILMAQRVPRERIVGGLTYISAVHTGPGAAQRMTARQRVVVGELGGGLSRRCADIAGAFVDVGVQGEATTNITSALWQKFVFLASLAAVCGLSRVNIGTVRTRPRGPELIERAVREAVAVGRARGVAFRDNEEQHVIDDINSLEPAVEPSLLLDLRSGSRTEVDVLSGAISRFGDEVGVDTPVHDTAAVALVGNDSMRKT